MCPKSITGLFSSPKVETPKPAPTPSAPAVGAASVVERQRAAAAVTSGSNRIVTDDRLDESNIRRPQLLGS